MKYESYPLGALCSRVTSGGTPKSTMKAYYDGGIPWLNTKEINFNRIHTTERYISPLGLNNSSAKWVASPAVIVAMYGATAGKVAVNLIPLTTNQACCNMEIREEKADFRYIYYYLKWKYKELSSLANGGAQQNLSAQLIREFPILLPSLAAQQSIADILWRIDDKIELNQRINVNLRQQMQTLFKAWFVDFLPFGGSIPAGWKYINFSDFLTPRIEKSDDPSLPMYSVTDNGIFPRDEKFKKNLSMSKTKNKIIHQTDLVFGMSREILNWGIMRNPIGGVSLAYSVYKVDEQINSFYLESYMKANYSYFKDLIKPASREGQGIDKNALMQKEILVPPHEVLMRYYSIEDAFIQTAHHALEENRQLVAIRDTLLPKLMSGEIEL